jgi:hypothetical protein
MTGLTLATGTPKIMAKKRVVVSLLAAFFVFTRGAIVPGESCPLGAPGRARACAAAQDWAVVVDNSLATTPPLHSNISSALEALVDLFALDASSASSPRLTLISFDEPSTRPCTAYSGCSADGAAEVLAPLSADANALRRAIRTRPSARGLSCISCGISLAEHQLRSVRGEGRTPVILLLAGSSQTAGGTDALAMHTAELVKDANVTVLTIALGGTMLHNLMATLATQPAAAYSQARRSAPHHAAPRHIAFDFLSR